MRVLSLASRATKRRTRRSAAITLLLALTLAAADEPRIYLITPFLDDQVLLHFDTEPNRTYVLQYTDSAPDAVHGFKQAVWSNLFTVPAFPFAGHYGIVDTRQAVHRFYRLSVTP
jgi:hypothetical protein